MFDHVIETKNLKVASFKDVLNVLKCYENSMIPPTGLKKFVYSTMTVPITTCTTERSFSMLRRMKTYLRIGQADRNLQN